MVYPECSHSSNIGFDAFMPSRVHLFCRNKGQVKEGRGFVLGPFYDSWPFLLAIGSGSYQRRCQDRQLLCNTLRAPKVAVVSNVVRVSDGFGQRPATTSAPAEPCDQSNTVHVLRIEDMDRPLHVMRIGFTHNIAYSHPILMNRKYPHGMETGVHHPLQAMSSPHLVR
jgi:hypothetical protein